MKYINSKLLFGCAVKHLDEMYFFVAEELLESLRFFSSLHNLWVLENVRELEGIFMQRSNYFHLVKLLLVLAIDLFQLAESFSKLGKISWERVEI